MIFDGLDGRIARMTNTSSKFGAEYDSLSDMVSFGVAPALVMFSWALGELGKFGWSAAFVYVACAALRLARFNTQIDTADKNYFTGLASPAAAAVVASTVWVCHDLGWTGPDLPFEVAVLVALLTTVLGLLMMANFPYYSFKGVDFRGRVPFVAMILLVLGIQPGDAGSTQCVSAGISCLRRLWPAHAVAALAQGTPERGLMRLWGVHPGCAPGRL